MTNKLPQGWVECELKDIFDTSSGGTPKRGNPAYYGGDIPWMKSGELNNGIVSEAEEFITEEGLKNSSAKLFPRGSLLIALYGATVGKLGILDFDSTTNQAICCIYQNNNYNRDFLFYYLLYKKEYLVNQGKGGAQPNISQEIIKALKIPVPSLNEQKRIVEKIEEEFGKIDEGVEKLKLAQEQIKQYRQSVLKSAFDGKLYKTTKWGKYTIKDISTNIQYGYTESASSNKIGPKFLRITDIQNNSVNWDTVPYCKISNDNKSKYLLKNGDFVFARTGATVGKSYMIQNLNEEAVYASYLIRIGFMDNIETKFIKYYFQTNEYWAQIADNQVGIGQPNVNGTKLGNLTINLPTVDEQKQIVKEIEKRFKVADEVERVITENLEKAEQLKQSILKKAFEGRLVPQDPTDQPASELLAQIQKERKNSHERI